MRKMTENLKVTCHLLDGRVNSADGMFYLDAILYHAWFLKHMPQVFEGQVERDQVKYVGLPLTQLEGNRWAASCGFYIEHAQNIEYWTKKPNIHGMDAELFADFEGKREKIGISSGEFRSYRMPQVIRTIDKVEFYCVGNPDKICDLLTRIKYLGKKSSIGYGAIKSWTVERVDKDCSTLGPYGLMRPLETSEITLGDEYLIGTCGIRPPYWKPVNHRVCYIPEVKINEYR